jgi:hypothetical protein
MEVKQLEREVMRCEQLLAQCDLEICTLEGLIAHQEAGGSEIYDSAPPHAFEESEYRIDELKKYKPEILERSGQQILADLKFRLSEYQQKLPELIANYQKALAAYQKTTTSSPP